jgi:mRNA-degrading endonuclease toxin of MazEF toxin-antitoxin module
LIVSEDGRNELTDDILVVPLFTRGRRGPTHVFIPEGEGGLPHASVAFCEEVTCIDVAFLDEQTGPMGNLVSQTVLEEVIRGVRRAMGEFVPEGEPVIFY